VLPAAEAPRAVVLRRGPSPWYHVMLWHTDTDHLEHGAWFRGRIYEERCDVSPDGELLLYFAMQGRKTLTSYKGSWTAVSRVPWLHALALWPQGHTWGGGGRFVGPREIVLATDSTKTHPDHPMDGLRVTLGVPPLQIPTERMPGADWVGRDFAGELIWAAAGGLFRRRRGKDLLVAELDGLVPDPQPPPKSATKRLPRFRTPVERSSAIGRSRRGRPLR
jgi:hypothetical protein